MTAEKREKPKYDPLSVGVNAAADMVGLSRAAVYNELRMGRLKAFKHGSRRLIPVTELHAWLARMIESGGIDTHERVQPDDGEKKPA